METYCHQTQISSPLGPTVCVVGDKSVEPSGVLWGDSLAGALLKGLDEQLLLKKHSFYAVISDGCIPIEGGSSSGFDCTSERHTQFVEEVIKQSQLKSIVWFGSFVSITETDSAYYSIDGVKSSPQIVENKINQTLDKLRDAGKEVVIVGDTPRFPEPVAQYAIKAYRIKNGNIGETVQTISKQEQLNQTKNLSRILNNAQMKAIIIDGLNVFCEKDTCSSHDENGALMFVDSNHLSNYGARKLGKVILDLLYQ